MRTGGLRDRIAESLGNQPEAAEHQARLLDELARALRETADTATSIRPAPSAREMAERAGEPAPGMPSILKSMPQRQPAMPLQAAGAMPPPAPSTSAWLGSPAIFAAGIASVVLLALLIVVRPIALTFEPGLGLQRNLVETQVISFRHADAAALAPDLSPTDRAMLAQTEALIEHGDLRAAREILARAAADGSFVARFALAETFDPNMLAAWGAREQVADVSLARTLYGQAQSAGDARAARRIEALQGE